MTGTKYIVSLQDISEIGVRPVINLKSDVELTETGTRDSSFDEH